MNLSHSSEFCYLRHLQQAYMDYNIYIYAYNILISVNIYCEYINIHLYYSITVYIEFTSMIPEYRQNAGEGLEDEMGRSESKWSAY